jgi:hypothetical protein
MFTNEFKTAATQFFNAAEKFLEAAGMNHSGVRLSVEMMAGEDVLSIFKPLQGNLVSINRSDLFDYPPLTDRLTYGN